MYQLNNAPSHDSVNETNANNDQNGVDWRYHVLPEICFHNEIGKYTTFGIQGGGVNYVEILHDVATSKETVVQLTELFNRHQLSPLHLRDVVMDMLP